MGRSILITGGNRGLGAAVAARLRARGHQVVTTAREPGRASGGEGEALRLDLAKLSSVRSFAEEVRGRGLRFTVVLQNAGVLFPSPERRLTEDGFEEALQVHAVGPWLLMRLLAPWVERPGRFVLVGSRLHIPGRFSQGARLSLADPNLDAGYQAERSYHNSKLAQLWVSSEWERREGGKGLHAEVVCPGFVPETAAATATGARRFFLRWVLPWMPFATTREEAARVLAERCEAAEEEPGGRYFQGGALAMPSAEAQDGALAARFVAWMEAKIPAALLGPLG